ncbi:MAG: helix-turn-helix transcriptional regulator [Patescibacteria group bacterium]|nr:helix-turn-helix transcriptional regulator [Patescibacteria group bacterium]
MIEKCHIRVGHKIKILRECFGMTQEDLAIAVGIGRTSIANIETGRQRLLLHSIAKFAKALGVEPEMLLKNIWK